MRAVGKITEVIVVSSFNLCVSSSVLPSLSTGEEESLCNSDHWIHRGRSARRLAQPSPCLPEAYQLPRRSSFLSGFRCRLLQDSCVPRWVTDLGVGCKVNSKDKTGCQILFPCTVITSCCYLQRRKRHFPKVKAQSRSKRWSFQQEEVGSLSRSTKRFAWNPNIFQDSLWLWDSLTWAVANHQIFLISV